MIGKSEDQNVKVKKYIEDEIEEKYQKWQQGDIIFITGSTGSGKSHFILHILLEWVIKQRGKILYLVNRKILKEQIENELYTIVTKEMNSKFEWSIQPLYNYIKVETYQSVEKGLLSKDPFKTIGMIRQCNYVVCDEAHYFYMDSNFNTNTELSYDCIRKEFNSKIQIYMSATIGKVEKLIRTRKTSFLPYTKDMQTLQLELLELQNKRYHSYGIVKNYDYIRLFAFEDLEELKTIILNEIGIKEKWLIFVDNIDAGENFRRKLIENENNKRVENRGVFTEEQVVFIDANYNKDEIAKATVQDISESYRAEAKVLISTAVMDNGISLHDEKLRNIVILADTEETFIQMLGRKRDDNEKINLYVCKRDISHFSRRVQQTERVLNCYNQYANKLGIMYVRYLGQRGKMTVTPYTDLVYRDACDIPTSEGGFFNYHTCINYDFILKNQQEIVCELLSDHIASQNIKKFCYSVNGIIAVNSFAIARCRDLLCFYNEMIQELEKDKDAFIKKQAEWLRLSEDSVQNAIDGLDNENREKLRESIEVLIKNIIEENKKYGVDNHTLKFNRDQNIEWKRNNKKLLLYFVNKKNSESKESDIKDIGQPDRPISPERFLLCMKAARLPYRIEKPNQKEFEIYLEDENKNLQTPEQ